jgi:large subunit ribosomal protein L4
MPTIQVKRLDSDVTESLELSEVIFATGPKNALVYETVKHRLAGLRRGCASTKTRGLVSGSGRKLWRQKGTGRARVGSIRSPIWRHGGTVFGPLPRDYSYRMPIKAQKAAMRSALSSKFSENRILAIQNFSLGSPKTKEFVAMMKKLDLTGSILLVHGEQNNNLALASRNIQNVKLIAPSELNVYDVLKYRTLVFSRSALEKVENIFKK